MVLLRNRLLQLRAEVDEWPDARHGLRVAESGDSADADELVPHHATFALLTMSRSR